MTNYSSILTQLCQQAKLVQNNTDYHCFSLYLPFDSQSQVRSQAGEMAAKFKSLVETSLSQFLSKPEQKELRLELVRQLSNLSGLFDYHKAGVCVYAVFNKLDKQYKGGNDKNASSSQQETLLPFTQTVPLFTLPSNNPGVLIEQGFDLIPLLDNLHFNTPQLVLDLHEDNSRLHDFSQMQLTPIKTIQNTFEKFPSTEEYLDERSPGAYGTHSNRKDHNYDSDYLHQHMKDDIMPELQKYKNTYKSVMIVGGDKYLEQIQPFIESLQSNFDQVETLSFASDHGNKTIEDLLVEDSAQKIKKLRQSPACYQKNSEIQFETNPAKILEACAKGQVKTLYIKPQYRPDGFIAQSDPNLFAKFTDPQTGQKESIELHKITPFLTQQVIEMGGEVVPITIEDSAQNSEYKPLLASFRF